MKTEIESAVDVLAKKITSDIKPDDAMKYAQAMLSLAQMASVTAHTPQPTIRMVDVDEMVTRFLSWTLPNDFYPDAGISFTKNGPRPIGTNLFTAIQARAMITYMLVNDEPRGIA